MTRVSKMNPVLFSPENAEVCAKLSAGQEGLVREIISRAAERTPLRSGSWASIVGRDVWSMVTL